ncbi:MAG: hypothetical protein IPP79_18805 [Chitinophagaceae bacterium]|nr:hypothetical protein [Chitinophagaceae bacterium]
MMTLSSFIRISAQNPYIRHYTMSEGLPSNTVYQIYQDSHKFLWFTTDAGVSRYDGTNFKILARGMALVVMI